MSEIFKRNIRFLREIGKNNKVSVTFRNGKIRALYVKGTIIKNKIDIFEGCSVEYIEINEPIFDEE
jgi:hypothetical protein